MTIVAQTCRHCTSEINPGDRFCRLCGVALVGDSRLRSPLLNRNLAAPSHPLVKAESVLVCALSVFVLSAALWIGNSLKIAPGSKREQLLAKQKAAAAVIVTESEVDRLMKQAAESSSVDKLKKTSENAPLKVEPVTKEKLIVDSSPVHFLEAAVHDGEGEKTLPSRFARRERELALVQEHPDKGANLQKTTNQIDSAGSEKVTAKLKPARTTIAKMDDLALYNQHLANYFARKGSSTTDGVSADGGVSEPPTYEEWLASGKPAF